MMKRERRVLPYLLGLMALVVLIIGGTRAAKADVTPTANWLTNSYREGAYHITNAADLLAFANETKKPNTFKNQTVVLDNDIYWTGTDADEAKAAYEKWIGGDKTGAQSFVGIGPNTYGHANAFWGTFKGNGHTIYGLYIYKTSGVAGLFTHVNRSIVQDLTLDYCYEELSSAVTGDWGRSGILCGVSANDGVNDSRTYTTWENITITENCTLKTNANVASVGVMIGHGMGATIKGCTVNGNLIANGGNRLGGFIGNANGSASTITNSSFGGEITATLGGNAAGKYGGFVGTLSAAVNLNISNSEFKGTINAKTQRAGGFVGEPTSGTVNLTNCLFTGTLNVENPGAFNNAGGMVGLASATVNLKQCLAAGTINVGTSTGGYGSLIGQVSTSKTASITDCFADSSGTDGSKKNAVGYNSGTVTGYAVSLLKGSLYGVNGFHLTNLPFPAITSDTGDGFCIVEGDIPHIYNIYKKENKQMLPVPANGRRADYSWYYNSGNTTKSSPYSIGTIEALYGLAGISKFTTFSGSTFNLTANITDNTGTASTWGTTAPTNVFPMIGGDGDKSVCFQGKFNGGGYTISGIYVHGEIQGVGLFTQMNGAGQIYNFTLENSFIGQFANSQSLGGIVGRIRNSTSADCKAVYDVTVGANTVISRIKGPSQGTGGIVGQAWGTTVYNCHFKGTLNVSVNSICVGGIVGFTSVEDNTLNIIDCTFSGTMDTTKVDYNVGGIFGGLAVAGGSKCIVNINSCTFSGAINGKGRFGGIAGGSTRDGGTLVIKNCECTEKATLNGTGNNIGGIVAECPSIITLTVEDTKFNGIISSTAGWVGGIVGPAYYNAAGSTIVINNCTVGGTITAGGDGAGGIVGGLKVETNLTIKNSHFNGKVETEGAGAGGFVATVDGGTDSTILISNSDVSEDATIKGAYNNGGIIGYVLSPLAECTLTGIQMHGTITGTADATSYNGGIIGSLRTQDAIENNVSLTDIYCDGKIDFPGTGNGQCTAGFIGQAAEDTFLTFTRCEFAGEVYHKTNTNTEMAGGFIGQLAGEAHFTDCLFTGKVIIDGQAKVQNANVAGFVGMAYGSASELYLTRCVSAGEVHATGNNAVASIVGNIQGAGYFENVYVNDKVYISASTTKATESKGVGVPGNAGKVTGDTVVFQNEKAHGINAYFIMGTALGLNPATEDSAWCMVEDDIPALKVFLTIIKKEAYDGGSIVIAPSSRLKKGDNTSFATITGNTVIPAFDQYTLIAQAKSGYTFEGWYLTEDGTGECLGTELTLTGSVIDFGKEEVAIYAIYDFGSIDSIPLTVDGSSVKITEEGKEPVQITAEYQLNVTPGTTITVSFLNEDVEFYGWVNESGRVISKDKEYTFKPYSAFTIKAQEGGKNECIVTFLSSYNQVLSALTYKEDATEIAFPTVASQIGLEFTGYSVDGETIEDKSAAENRILSLIKNEHKKSIIVRQMFTRSDATYETRVVKVFVENSQIIELGDPISMGEIPLASIANISTDETVDDGNQELTFLFYMNTERQIISYSREFRYRSLTSDTLLAVYGKETVEAKPEIHMTVAHKNGSTFTVAATRTLPETYEIVEQGILIMVEVGKPTDEAKALALPHLYVGDKDVKSYKSTGVMNDDVTTLNLKNLQDNMVVVTRGYMIVRKTEDSAKPEIYYSDEIAYCSGAEPGAVIGK